MDDKEKAGEIVNFIKKEIGEMSFNFLCHYSAFNCHMRRMQAKELVEKYKEVDSIILDRKDPWELKNEDMIKAFYAIDLISKAGMISEDLAILCIALQSGVRDIEQNFARGFGGSKIETFYSKIDSKDDKWAENLFALPDIEKELNLNGEEKKFLKEKYSKHCQIFKGQVKKTGKFRKECEDAIKKSKHGNPILFALEPKKNQEVNFAMVLTKKQNSRVVAVPFNRKIVENIFQLICEIQEIIRDITIAHTKKYCSGGYKWPVKLYGTTEEEKARIKELEKKQKRQEMVQPNFKMQFEPTDPKKINERIKFLEEELGEITIELPKEFNFPISKKIEIKKGL